MPLPPQWTTPEDFASLFQYFWHRDFPIDERIVGARRSDWTIHVGVAVRSISDLMGLTARFESGNRKDAVLRSWQGDEIAVTHGSTSGDTRPEGEPLFRTPI